MFERMKALRARLRELSEIDEMTEHDLVDLGLSREQMKALITIPRDVADRVARMAEIFGVDPRDLTADRSGYVDILCNCADCKARVECAHEMAKGEDADPENCGFCVNAGSFALLSAQPAKV